MIRDLPYSLTPDVEFYESVSVCIRDVINVTKQYRREQERKQISTAFNFRVCRDCPCCFFGQNMNQRLVLDFFVHSIQAISQILP